MNMRRLEGDNEPRTITPDELMGIPVKERGFVPADEVWVMSGDSCTRITNIGIDPPLQKAKRLDDTAEYHAMGVDPAVYDPVKIDYTIRITDNDEQTSSRDMLGLVLAALLFFVGVLVGWFAKGGM